MTGMVMPSDVDPRFLLFSELPEIEQDCCNALLRRSDDLGDSGGYDVPRQGGAGDPDLASGGGLQEDCWELPELPKLGRDCVGG